MPTITLSQVYSGGGRNTKLWFNTDDLTLFMATDGTPSPCHPESGFDRAKLLACCLRVRDKVPENSPAWRYNAGSPYFYGSWAHVVATLLEGAGLTESVLGGSRE